MVQNSVMNEELVQNGVMRRRDERKFVRNFVMNANIDPKVVMELSTFTVVDGHFTTQQPKFSGRIYG